jgi:autotransporter-associated beta strand protein
LSSCDFAVLAVFATVLAMTQMASGQTTTWSGAGPDLIWSTAANWTTVGGSTPPGSGDTAVFGNGAAPATTNAAGAVDCIVTNSPSVSGLQYLNVSPNAHTTLIAAGQTLTVNGLVIVGVASSTTVATMTGTGNFTVNNPTANFNVGGAGLSTATVTLTLADGTNTIVAKTLSLGESASNNGRQCIINLGGGTNIINADTINMGTGKGSGNITWVGATTTGRLTIRNTAGTGRATMLLGNGTSGSGSSSGRLLMAGHPADILAGTLTMGRLGNDTGNQAGILTVDNGMVDATSIQMGVLPATGVGAGTATGSILTIGGDPVNSATLIVNSPSGPGGGSFIVSDSSNATAARNSSATFNLLQNGVAQVYCSITKAQVSQNTSTINITSGKLTMGAATNTIGTPAVPIDNLTLDTATLQFSEDGSSLNAAAVNLTMNGATNLVNIAALPPIVSLPTTIPIITYTSFGGGFNMGVGTLPGDYQGYITNDGVSTISLVINAGTVVPAKHLEWLARVNTNWDTTTFNWTNAGVNFTNYSEADYVTFSDKASSGNVALLGAQHAPSSLTVSNNTLNYAFSGPAKIAGATSLIKQGTASLTLGESGGDSFAGGIAVHGGTVVLDEANSSISGGLTADSGTTVQIGNNDANGALPAGTIQINGSLVFSNSNNRTIATVIGGSGSVTQSGTNTLTITGVNGYGGGTMVGNGTLVLSGAGTLAGGAATVRNATLDISAATTPTFTTVALSNGTFNVAANPTTLSALNISNSTIVLTTDYGNVGGAAIVTGGNVSTGGTTNMIRITAINNLPLSPTVPFSIPLISYTSFSGSFNVGWTNLPGITGYITTNPVASTIDLVVTSAPQNLTWNGGSATVNLWTDAANWSGTPIAPLDGLIFDGALRVNNTNDTAAGTTYVAVTFNPGASAFTLNGASIGLSGTMLNSSPVLQTVKLGLALNHGCALDGGTSGLTMSGGVTNTTANNLTVSNLNIGTISDLWQSTNGGRLQIRADAGAEWAVVDGTGTGALVQCGNVQLNANGGIVDFGTVGSQPNLDLGFTTNGLISVDSNPGVFNMNYGTVKAYSMTAGGNGTVNAQVNINGGLLLLGAGTFTAGGGAGASTTVITITNGSWISTNGGNFTLTQRSAATVNQSGGLLQCGAFVLTTGQTVGGNGIVNLNGGTLSVTNVSVGSAGANAWGLINHNGGTFKIGASSGTLFTRNNFAPLTNIIQAGGAIIDTAGSSTAFNTPLITDPNLSGSPDGGLIKLGAGTLTLSSANTYIGPTAVNAGTLLVSGLVAGDVNVAATGTLGGAGAIAGLVTVNGTVAPGAATIGTLTVSSNVVFNGSATNAMRLNKSGTTNDVLSVAGTLSYGGTLSLTNLSGTLAATDTFKLFSAGAYAGSFARLSPAVPGTGLLWNTNTLTTDGILRLVSSVNTGRTNITAVHVGNQLTLSWPADHIGWRLQVETNSVAVGLRSNWVDVAGSTTTNSVTVPINPGIGSVFYRMVYP